ncbi:peptidase M23 [Microbacterium sp. Clip185]|uniref:peptidase M23 n=1 Tax=Microbacterium sp. Clip185 TaxID=3025663 RepID=UPI0023670C0B|nr:peptidase M23 [Microbacterium sp. Clip185]WDG18704.1 peptidase M23 [Microbacterium sp. Clip185]
MARRPSTRRRRPPARRRGARGGLVAAVIALAAAPLILIVALLAAGSAAIGAFDSADRIDVGIGDAPRPPGIAQPAIAGYGSGQLANACTILAAGRDLGFDERDQTIAIMTAMGESSLRNLDYGDWETSGVTNPDGTPTTSIGLFQQQDSWGSRDERLDPYTAATIFYRAMAERVPDRASLDPTQVAHETQVNADPLHYARFWDRAVRVVAALNGTPREGDRTDGITLCPAA